MSEVTTPVIPSIKPLADFRFQLRTFLSFSEETAERYGVATQQYQLMQVIAAMPSEIRASITYLAERMVLRHNSMVELVDRAERAGLVRRDSDPDDLRRSIVSLTLEGYAVLQKMVTEHLAELKLVGPALIASLTTTLEELAKLEVAPAQ